MKRNKVLLTIVAISVITILALCGTVIALEFLGNSNGSWNISPNFSSGESDGGVVTDFDLALVAGAASRNEGNYRELFFGSAEAIVGKYLHFNNGVVGDTAKNHNTIYTTNALCFNHNNIGVDGQYYRITDIADISAGSTINTGTIYSDNGTSFNLDEKSEISKKILQLAYLMEKAEEENSAEGVYKKAASYLLFQNRGDLNLNDGYYGYSDTSYTNNVDGNKLQEAVQYQNSLNFEKNKNTVPNITRQNGKTYIGPMNVKRDSPENGGIANGSITSISVTPTSGGKYYAIGISKSNGGQVLGINSIKSEEDFYVVINESLNVNAKITIWKDFDVYAARLMFLLGSDDCGNITSSQQLVVYSAYQDERSYSLEWDTDTPELYGNLLIVKTDADNTSKRLSGVTFQIKNSSGSVNLTRTTGTDGSIFISQIPVGNYTVEEKSNSNPEYDNSSNIGTTKQITVTEATKTHQEIVEDILFSQEANENLPNITNKEIISKLYSAILQRRDEDIVESEVNSIAKDKFGDNSIDNKTRTTEQLKDAIHHFVGSKEFTDGNLSKEGFKKVIHSLYEQFFLKRKPSEIPSENDSEVLQWFGKNIVQCNITNKKTPEEPKYGNLKIIKRDSDNPNVKLPNVTFQIRNSSNVLVKTITTGSDGVATAEKLPIGKYTVKETSNPNNGYNISSNINKTVSVTISEETTTYKYNEVTVTNIQGRGSLKIIKTDKDSQELLPGIKFKVANSSGSYITTNDNNYYTGTSSSGTEFTTDSLASILITNLPMGDYTIHETGIDETVYHEKYTVSKETLTVSLTANAITTANFTNKRENVDISGKVWEDNVNGKSSQSDNLYYSGTSDKLVKNVKVYLKDRQGNIKKWTETNAYGLYSFENLNIDDLPNLYVEFEYNGLGYTNVPTNVNRSNGSKASESSFTRTEFNNNFSQIINSQVNSSSSKYIDLSYNSTAHTSTLNWGSGAKVGYSGQKYPIAGIDGRYMISATTNYISSIMTPVDIRENGITEITNINLGLKEREQPDLAIAQDIQSVKATINGYENVYEYGNRSGNYTDGTGNKYGEESFNAQVKFGQISGKYSYTRKLYKADYMYTTQDLNKELKLYITYKITVRNEATTLTSVVNDITNYFDSRYSVVGYGTNYSNGIINGMQTINQSQRVNDNYSKCVLSNTFTVGPQSESSVYVQFELNRAAIEIIMNSNENSRTLGSIAEINNYSTYSDTRCTKLYAGIDKDSAPNNFQSKLGNSNLRNYLEDDTDLAPDFKLEISDAREINGTTFVDKSYLIENRRQGDGIYKPNEDEILVNANVNLIDADGRDVKVYTIKGGVEGWYTTKDLGIVTDSSGNYTIGGLIPGEYKVKFTWGENNGGYSVQDFKGTVYNLSRDQNDKEWYKKEVDTRYTDAIDDYVKRLEIDQKTDELTKDTQINVDTLDSLTPTMRVAIELETTTNNNTIKYQIKNVDFGIVERAKQKIELDKRIEAMKLVLANGQVIANITIEEDANGKKTVKGENKNVAYGEPISSDREYNRGFLKLELDNELIEGSKLEVQYTITAKNNSELDYVSEDYYKYGKIEDENRDLVTVTPGIVIDYLDNTWSFDKDKSEGWSVKTADEIKNLVIADVFDRADSTIRDKTILYTESLVKELKPTESVSSSIYVSKVLSAQDQIYLNNEAEVVKIKKNGGTFDKVLKPGDYVPGSEKISDPTEDFAETVMVSPPTGENKDYQLTIIIAATVLSIMTLGIISFKIIKKRK